jgi:hypothetical protein
MDVSRGATLALLGVALFVVTMSVSAATAPSLDVERSLPNGTPTETPTDGAPSGTTTVTPERGTATPVGPRTLVGMQGTWTEHGSVFLLSGDEEVWRDGSADSYFEVSRLDDGTVLAAFANDSATECGELKAPCGRTGFRHIDPSGSGGPKVVSEYSFPVGSLTNSEVHAVDRINEGTYVFTDMDEERIAIVDNGTEVWEWRASTFYDAPEDPTSRDWLHINDVDTIGDGRFLVSVRNANQLVVVERGSGVVEVINEDDDADDSSCTDKNSQLRDTDGDSDVRCGDPSVIDHQHNPQWLGPGAVLVADSDNDRITELHRTDDGDWEVAWVLRSAGGIELRWPRDADRLPNGHTLITDSLNERVFEIDGNGNMVWSVGTDRIPYEADRLPMGEYAGGYDAGTPTDSPDGNGTATPDERTPLPTANRDGDVNADDTGSDIPGLTIAVVGLRGTFSWLPVWFKELQLAATILSLGLVAGGGVDYWRNGRD